MPVNGRWVVIKLGDRRPGVTINRLGVSAMFSSRFVGLRSFDAYSCRAGKRHREPDLRRLDRRRLDEDHHGAGRLVPGREPAAGDAGRVAPVLRRKSPQPLATHVKFVVTNNQCTGQPSFQGDQDLDPANNSECRTGIRRSEVHTAEVEVFATKTTVDGTLVTAS